ncbi:MAG: RluA family pseudouridine synthase [Planctomycetes bacterium]|nr:RluA family pseudouridine synthase [Planctomycetota bacterium]
MSKREKSPFQLIHLDPSDDGSVLERALKKRLTDWSWGDIRDAIRRRRVQVNGNLCMDLQRKVNARDVIKLWNESLPKPIEASDIRIVYADDFLVVVEKPAGITSVRHFEERNLSRKRRQLQPTFEELIPEALMHHFQSQRNASTSDRSGLPGPRLRDPRSHRADAQKSLEALQKRYSVIAVHRLDRDTSGLMIFARTPSIAQSLGKSFKNHRIVRKYHAVVLGHPAEQTFDSILVRDRGDGHRGSKPADRGDDPTEQRAITHIRPLEKIGEYSLIECQLETGRTHQIRIHLSEARHLLCGDAIYCRNREGLTTQDTSNAPRQALHSATLAFDHPISGAKLSFKMPWPADLHRWLTQLRAKSP